MHVNLSGFKGSYLFSFLNLINFFQSGCNRTYDQSQGAIYSPGWPGRTRSPMECVFTVQVPDPAASISLYFGVFGVTASPNCSASFLEVSFGLKFASFSEI